MTVHAFGPVIYATIDSTSTHISRKKTVYYDVDYHFTVAGKLYREGESVSLEQFQTMRVGNTFRGQAISFPFHPLFLPPNSGKQTLILIGASLFWNSILSIFVYGVWIVPIRNRLLLRTGTTAEGVITSHRVVRGKSTSRYISYRFTTLLNEEGFGEYSVTAGEYDRAKVDSPVTVVYSESNPKRNMPYEFCEFCVD